MASPTRSSISSLDDIRIGLGNWIEDGKDGDTIAKAGKSLHRNASLADSELYHVTHENNTDIQSDEMVASKTHTPLSASETSSVEEIEGIYMRLVEEFAAEIVHSFIAGGCGSEKHNPASHEKSDISSSQSKSSCSSNTVQTTSQKRKHAGDSTEDTTGGTNTTNEATQPGTEEGPYADEIPGVGYEVPEDEGQHWDDFEDEGSHWDDFEDE